MGKGAHPNQTRANGGGRALAVPLEQAAQVLGKPLHELEQTDVRPLRHAQGHDVYLLRELALALGIIQPAKRRNGKGDIKQDPIPLAS